MMPMPTLRSRELSRETSVPRHTVRPLSPLEREIILLAEQGMSVREIAYHLAIDTRLVRVRLRKILGPPTPARRQPRARLGREGLTGLAV